MANFTERLNPLGRKLIVGGAGLLEGVRGYLHSADPEMGLKGGLIAGLGTGVFMDGYRRMGSTLDFARNRRYSRFLLNAMGSTLESGAGMAMLGAAEAIITNTEVAPMAVTAALVGEGLLLLGVAQHAVSNLNGGRNRIKVNPKIT